MTVKELAAAVGKDPATVSRWVERVSCKVQEVFCKVQEAKATKRPADYTLEESCQIIEEGMGAAAADVYRTNAANAALEATRKPTKTPNGKQLQVLAHNLPPAEFRKLALAHFAPWLLEQPAPPAALQIEGPEATAITRKAASIGAAVAHRVAAQAIAKANDENRQGRLL